MMINYCQVSVVTPAITPSEIVIKLEVRGHLIQFKKVLGKSFTSVRLSANLYDVL